MLFICRFSIGNEGRFGNVQNVRQIQIQREREREIKKKREA